MMSEAKITVLLVDDHQLVRLGLKSLLSLYPNIEVVGEAANSQESVKLAESLKPDIILMDIRMHGESGIDACKKIVSLIPGMKVIMLTSYDEEEIVYEAIMAGASGYILKEIESEELIKAIETVAAGQSLLDPNVTLKVMERLRNKSFEDQKLNSLTGQEKQVLALIAKGKTNKEIGAAMHLTEKTIRNYVSQIFLKLELSNRAQAAAFAVKNKLDT